VLVLHSPPELAQPLPVTPGFLETILEEEYVQNKHLPTNLEEIFRACTLFGHSPREVRFDPSPLVSLWPPRERLIDVIPAVLWREELFAQPAAAGGLKVKVPAEWFFQYPRLFSTLDTSREKIILCHLAYSRECGLEEPENR
jgi:CRISPR-associated endonuclease/helicase Cas3